MADHNGPCAASTSFSCNLRHSYVSTSRSGLGRVAPTKHPSPERTMERTRSVLALVIASAIGLAACSNDSASPVSTDLKLAAKLSPKAASYMSNYVAIGTSITMGWASDGVLAGSQNNAWVKQLADEAGVD